MLAETMASYVPGLVLRRLAANQGPISQPDAQRIEAAVLFADISGFTAVAERLAQRGPDGVEGLSTLLNTYFGRMIEIIASLGGDIVKFAGDALLALWPAEPGQLGPATCKAAECGLAIQRALERFETGDDHRLTMRIGIAAGPVQTIHLGGVREHWELLVSGAPLIEVSAAEGLASPGDVVLAPQAWELVRECCQGTPIGQQGERASYQRLRSVQSPPPFSPPNGLPPPSEVEGALKAYMPGAILERLAAGQSAWLAELRRVTVLFINVPDLSQISSLELGQTIMQALQSNIYHYEGSVNKLSVDDKGVTLVAALGLPPLAHEDDPVRGAQAALSIQAALQELNVRHAIGVCTGKVFCGAIGSERRREYTMVGDVVNLAARLMQAAHDLSGDAVLCDRQTYEAATETLSFEELAPIEVKGKSGQIAIYRPHRRGKKLSQQQAPMIGRDAERALLIEQLQALRQGALRSVVIVEAEAGMGKSRLIADLVGEAARLKLTCLVGAGDAIEKSAPYHAWRPIFNQILDLQLINEAEARREHALNLLELEPDLLPLAPLLNSVLALDIPENELTTHMTGQVRADNTRELLIRLLCNSMERSTKVLILDDAHWLDSASWALVQEIYQHVQPLLLVLSLRPLAPPLPAEYRQISEAAGTTQLLLEQLAPPEIHAMLCRAIGAEALPEEVRRLIDERAQGNPFFSEELLYSLRDSGLLTVKNGLCSLTSQAKQLQAHHLPDTVQGVITSRIDRLSPAQQLTLKVASVIGRIFAYRCLREIYPIEADKPELQRHLEQLQRLDITPLDTPEPDLTYLFKHVITQEVAYNLMAFAQRRELHSALASWYELVQADDLTPFYPLLVHHWSKAEQPARTLEYLEKAGEHALHSGAYQEALGFFSQALELDQQAQLGSPLLRRAHWEEQMGEAYYGLGNLEESRKRQAHVIELLDRQVPGSRPRLWAAIGSQVVRQMLHRLRPQRFLGSASQNAAALHEATAAYEVIGPIYYISNDPYTMLYVAMRALNISEAAGPSVALARVYIGMAIAAGIGRLHGLAESYIRQAEAIAEPSGDLLTIAKVCYFGGIYRMSRGQWEQAETQLKRACSIYSKLGARRPWEECMAFLGATLYYEGEFPQSALVFSEVYTSARHRDDTEAWVWARSGQARNALRQGMVDQAAALLEKSLPLLEQITDRTERILQYGLLGTIRLYQGDQQAAEQAADQAARLIRQATPSIPSTLEGYAGVACVYLSLWEHSAGEPQRRRHKQAAGAACKALRKYSQAFRIGQPRYWLLQGRYDWLRGRPARARQAWLKSLAYAEQLEMPYEQGLAHMELGLRGAGAERAEQLRRARAIFVKLGADYEIKRIDQAAPQREPQPG